VATNPDPQLQLSTVTGRTRSIDDWTTMFQLCLVVLPDQMEAQRYLPVARAIFKVFGDADCRVAFVVPSTPAIAQRILGRDAETTMTFVDPDRAFVDSLGLQSLPALVHIRQDTSVGDVAEGWDAAAWQRVADSIAAAMAWSAPEIAS
jgi:hypothetical protein